MEVLLDEQVLDTQKNTTHLVIYIVCQHIPAKSTNVGVNLEDHPS